MNFFYAFAAFALLVILHEFGHFAAAKKVGMQVTRFSLFFPPALFKFKRGETSYEVGAVPLGGFVKITGMNPEEEVDAESLPRAYFNQPVWKRIVVIAAGPAMNFLIAFILIFVLFAFVGTAVDTSTKIKTVSKESPAAGHIQPGDQLVSVNGKSGDAQALVTELSKSKCAGKPVDGCSATEPAEITIKRDGKTTTFSAVPKYDADVKRMRIGLSFDTITATEPIPQAFQDTVTGIWRVTKLTFSLPARIFNKEQRKQISSVVGGYEQTRIALKTDAETTIQVIALISLSLAIINLFPFLPLDGGHIFWALAEKVRGKPISTPVLERASFVGIALIGMLFVIGLSNDIERFRGGGFGP
jgi:regulator of sigma E protease